MIFEFKFICKYHDFSIKIVDAINKVRIIVSSFSVIKCEGVNKYVVELREVDICVSG